MPLIDSYNRTIDYLRVSVTDRCNFRCVYCMPEEGAPVSPKEEILAYEEIERLVRIATQLGMTKIRLTGGEPPFDVRFIELLPVNWSAGDDSMGAGGMADFFPLAAASGDRAGKNVTLYANAELKSFREAFRINVPTLPTGQLNASQMRQAFV